MEVLSVASRKAPQGAGRQTCSNKLFFLSLKTGTFLEPLGNACLKRLVMLYYECSSLNGLWSPFGFETFSGRPNIVLTSGPKWPVEPVRV